MKQIIHRGTSRGNANLGWLNSYHTFSFAGYHNSSRMHFGVLRVLNDDVVAPGRGFGAHPHENMEIISIPLNGALKHNDNTGRSEIINAGDVQIMSAGSGITHAEMNASATEPVNFLQIWIFPKVENIQPRYEQKTFILEDRKNKWQTIVSPEKDAEPIWINQDAWFMLSDLDENKTLQYNLQMKNNGVYLFVLDGEIEIVGEKLVKRDAIALTEIGEFDIKASTNAQLLLMEVPMI